MRPKYFGHCIELTEPSSHADCDRPLRGSSRKTSGFEAGVPNAIRVLSRPVGHQPALQLKLNYSALIHQLDSYVRQYVRRLCRTSGAKELADDALQYLLCVLLEDKHSAVADSHFIIPWSKRVVRNFVISEFRTMQRCNRTPPAVVPNSRELEYATETKHSVSVLVHLLRQQAARSGSVRGRLSRIAVFDEWVDCFFNTSWRSGPLNNKQRHLYRPALFRGVCPELSA
jgi:DNA-directed RNA polymerase specialized sigma24 family protein